jgi:hypothetical protein
MWDILVTEIVLQRSRVLTVIREDDEALPIWQSSYIPEKLRRARGARKFALLFENDCRNLVNRK